MACLACVANSNIGGHDTSANRAAWHSFMCATCLSQLRDSVSSDQRSSVDSTGLTSFSHHRYPDPKGVADLGTETDMSTNQLL